LKTGDTVNGVLGRAKMHSFKFKNYAGAKSKEIDFSEIESFQTLLGEDTIKTFYVFQKKKDGKYIALEEFVKGKKASLYGVVSQYMYNSMGAVGGMGGFNMSTTRITYYIKKTNDDKITLLGKYDPIIGDYRDDLLNYFSDCEKLVSKIENHEFKIRNETDKMVRFYNDNCD